MVVDDLLDIFGDGVGRLVVKRTQREQLSTCANAAG